MSLNELYQEIILDHGKRPRNFGRLDEPTHQAEGYNPLCGDQVRVTVQVEDGVIQDLRFEGCGCAISTASASIMSELVKGRKIEDAERMFHQFHDVVIGEQDTSEDLGELEALMGVRQFPSRIKCATLAWHALRTALHQDQDVVSTEG